jgi:CO/xanthine dehydrogenase Mo-binding subunit
VPTKDRTAPAAPPPSIDAVRGPVDRELVRFLGDRRAELAGMDPSAVAMVDVDLDTAEVTVRHVVAVDDVGRVVHPVLAEGQVEGGTLQAVGYATIEEIKVDGGRYVNDRLATYLIPTPLDAPRITTILVEDPFSGSPHGAKGLGELPMDVPAPAVVAAIADAVGVWITELPATPERILAAMAARTEEAPDADPKRPNGDGPDHPGGTGEVSR